MSSLLRQHGQPSMKTLTSLKKKAGESRAKQSSELLNSLNSNANAMKWSQAYEPHIVHKLNEDELRRAKEAFFQIDTDGSGTIDGKELGSMLRVMGLNPTDEEVEKMMAGIDSANNGGDGDGKINLREFLVFFAKTCKANRDVVYEDVIDAYRALRISEEGLSPTASKEAVEALFRKEYDIDIDVNDVFDLPSNSSEVTFTDFKKLMLKKKAAKA